MFKNAVIIMSNTFNNTWNRIMALIGGPFVMYIFLKHVELTSGFGDQTRLLIYFVLAVLFASAAPFEGILGGVLAWGLFRLLRPIFLAGFFGFNWWGSQTAFAGVAALAFVNFFIWIVSVRFGNQ